MQWWKSVCKIADTRAYNKIKSHYNYFSIFQRDQLGTKFISVIAKHGKYQQT